MSTLKIRWQWPSTEVIRGRAIGITGYLPAISYELLTKTDQRQIGELKQLVRLRRQNGKLVDGIFVFVARGGVDAVHGNHDAVTIHARRRCGGVKHCRIGRRAGYDQGFGAFVLEKSLELTAEELIECVGINDAFALFTPQRRSELADRFSFGRGRHGIDDRYGGGPRLVQEIPQWRGDFGADLLGIVAAGIEIKHQYRRALAVESERLRLGPVRTFLCRPGGRCRQHDAKKKQSGSDCHFVIVLPVGSQVIFGVGNYGQIVDLLTQRQRHDNARTACGFAARVLEYQKTNRSFVLMWRSPREFVHRD